MKTYLRLFVVVYFFVFTPYLLLAQGVIRGKIIDKQQREPLGFANIFLNNTKLGANSDENGNFIINNVPFGTYEIIASYVGYDNYIQSLVVQNAEVYLVIEMMPKSTVLKEIIIKDDKNWKYNYEEFLRGFIGQTSNSRQCKITNPDDLHIRFDADSGILKVNSRKPLIIENKALGYRITYILDNYRYYKRQQYQFFLGFALYEEMQPKSKSQLSRWNKRREEAYRGSTQHFFRELYKRNYEQSQFTVQRMEYRPNTQRAPEATIHEAIKSLTLRGITDDSDTLRYWLQEAKKPEFLEILHKPLLPPDSISVMTPDGWAVLRFRDNLLITYSAEKESFEYITQMGLLNKPRGAQTSVISLTQPYAMVAANGVLRDPLSIIYKRYWAWSEKIAETLPQDYVPKE